MKKNLFIFLLFTSLLFLAGISFAADSKVLIIPFISDQEKLKDTADELTNTAIDKVKASPRFSYVNREEFLENWFGKEGQSELFGKDIKKDFDLRSLFPMFDAEGIGTIAEYKDRWKIDFVLTCKIAEKDGLFDITMQLANIDTGRFYLEKFGCKPVEAKGVVNKHLSLLLEKSDELRKVMADGIIDPVMSTVFYDVTSVEGEKIRIVTDYTSTRPASELQNVSIQPLKRLENGEKKLAVKSEEGKIIEITTRYKKGVIDNVFLDANRPVGKGETSQTFFVRSEGGYLMKFVFRFKDSDILSVFVEPNVTPYP